MKICKNIILMILCLYMCVPSVNALTIAENEFIEYLGAAEGATSAAISGNYLYATLENAVGIYNASTFEKVSEINGLVAEDLAIYDNVLIAVTKVDSVLTDYSIKAYSLENPSSPLEINFTENYNYAYPGMLRKTEEGFVVGSHKGWQVIKVEDGVVTQDFNNISREYRTIAGTTSGTALYGVFADGNGVYVSFTDDYTSSRKISRMKNTTIDANEEEIGNVGIYNNIMYVQKNATTIATFDVTSSPAVAGKEITVSGMGAFENQYFYTISNNNIEITDLVNEQTVNIAVTGEGIKKITATEKNIFAQTESAINVYNKYVVCNTNLVSPSVGETFTSLPVKISGTVTTILGNNPEKAEITLGDVIIETPIGADGNFEYIINECKLTNGQYTVAVKPIGAKNSQTAEINLQLPIAHEVVTFEFAKKRYVAGANDISVSVNNNTNEDETFVVVTALSADGVYIKAEATEITVPQQGNYTGTVSADCSGIENGSLRAYIISLNNDILAKTEVLGEDDTYVRCDEITVPSGDVLDVDGTVNFEKGVVDVAGFMPTANGNTVYAMLSYSNTNLFDKLIYFAELSCDEFGKFSCEMPLKAAKESGDLDIKVWQMGIDSMFVDTKTITYCGTDYIDNILDKIKNFTGTGKTDSQIVTEAEGFFNDNIFDLDLTTYENMTEEFKSELFRELLGKNYTVKEYKDAFADICEKQYKAQIFKEQKANELNEINTCEQSAFQEKIEAYGTDFDLDMKLYASVTKENVIDMAFANRPYADETQFKDSFKTFCVIVAVNDADRNTMESVLIKHEDLLKLGVGTKINSNIIKGMASKSDYKTIAEIKAAYDAEVAALNSAGSQPSGTSPSGTSNGGTAGITTINKSSSSSVVAVTEPTKKEISFNDIEDYSWAKDGILELYEKGVIKGKSENVFAPADNVTREEFIRMVVGMLSLNADVEGNVFSDVDSNAWYAKDVNTAYKLGIVSGKGDGTFGIGEDIVREDAATMLYRALKVCDKLKYNKTPLVFADSDEISSYAKEAIDYCSAVGIIQGMGENKFDPKNNCNRAQAAVIISRIN